MPEEEKERQPNSLYLSATAVGTYQHTERGEPMIEIRQGSRTEQLGLTYWGVEGTPLKPGDRISVHGYVSCPEELLQDPILMIGGKVRIEK